MFCMKTKYSDERRKKQQTNQTSSAGSDSDDPPLRKSVQICQTANYRQMLTEAAKNPNHKVNPMIRYISCILVYMPYTNLTINLIV